MPTAADLWKISNYANRRQYELSNHLGNVMAVIGDYVTVENDTIKYPSVFSLNDYYVFGAKKELGNSSTYRYGFNGKENDNELKGEGNQQDYGMRIYDPRLGKFLSVDPIARKYPELAPYQFASNRTIQGIDLDGKEVFLVTGSGNGFFLFGGYEAGGGIAFGKDGIALVAYQSIKGGGGIEMGANINVTIFPSMQNLNDLDGLALGGSASGAYLGSVGLGVTKSSGHWGGTVSAGVGMGGQISLEGSITLGLKIIRWDQVAAKIIDNTPEGEALQKFFKIKDEDKSKAEQILKSYYINKASTLINDRLNKLNKDVLHDEQVLKEANQYLKDYNNSSRFYKSLNYLNKRKVESYKENAERRLEKNKSDIVTLKNIEINF